MLSYAAQLLVGVVAVISIIIVAILDNAASRCAERGNKGY